MGSSHKERTKRSALAIAGVFALSLLAPGCGGGSGGAKVAQVGTTTDATGSQSSTESSSSGPRAYSACMRSHGARSFPDPESEGHLLVTAAGGSPTGRKNGVDMDSPEVRAAARACRKLLPNGGMPPAAQLRRPSRRC